MIISWWSGGLASALTCKLCIDEYGLENVRIIFQDTMNEHEDTYRFKIDCEKWYSKEIETIKSEKWGSIQEIWRRYKSLNTATGAVCSTELKRRVREDWQKNNTWIAQAFGFTVDEIKRSKSRMMEHPKLNAIFPLIEKGYTKKDVYKIIIEAGLEPPKMYKLGFDNNNCFGTGCTQGGIGYWKKIQKEYPEKFEAMAKMEHELTNSKLSPVTICKDQSKRCDDTAELFEDFVRGNYKVQHVFLLPHPDYPDIPCLYQMEGREPEGLTECNGFCGIDQIEMDL